MSARQWWRAARSLSTEPPRAIDAGVAGGTLHMHAIVAGALKQRILVIILAGTLMVGGLFAYKTLNIEAYPDPVPPLVDIITQNPGQSSEEIERYITVPIEIQMAGLPYVQAIRTISLFGLSDGKVQFTYDVSYQQASQMVINRLTQLGNLPNGAQPVLSPTSPIGEIFRYRVVGPPGYSVTDLRPSRTGFCSA